MTPYLYVIAAALFVTIPLFLMSLSRSNEGKRCLWGIVILAGVLLVASLMIR